MKYVCTAILVACGGGHATSPDSGSGSRDAGASADAWGALDTPVLIEGTSTDGAVANTPADWPAAAGAWNGKAASYCAGSDSIVFESTRGDLLGGSTMSAAIKLDGIPIYYQAGPSTGTIGASGTSVLYVADGEGRAPRCIGCTDVVDGVDGVQIYRVAPSATGSAATLEPQTGATIYSNRNKDLPHWTPDCQWILAGVEMPTHAATHATGSSELGMYNDLWAISADGTIWVQLTDYKTTWAYADTTAPMPFQCTDSDCPTGCQYGSGAPFGAYSCSGSGAPPPATGTMRPIVGNQVTDGAVPVVWSERVGITLDMNQPRYTWGGVLQLATAELVMSNNQPALVNYRRNLTPTPASPAGVGLWNGSGTIGAGYESWAFSDDDHTACFASDVMLSTSNPAVHQVVSTTSEAFTDSIAWTWDAAIPALDDLTAYDATVYAYTNNAVNDDGHWEEPVVPSRGAAQPFYAFASSANLDPTWVPGGTPSTFGLEVWLVRADRSAPAAKLTHFNEPATAPRVNAYATAVNPADQSLYVSVAPGGTNVPGALYRLRPTLP